eukprot:695226-Rhodomonas_salina.3
MSITATGAKGASLIAASWQPMHINNTSARCALAHCIPPSNRPRLQVDSTAPKRLELPTANTTPAPPGGGPAAVQMSGWAQHRTFRCESYAPLGGVY